MAQQFFTSKGIGTKPSEPDLNRGRQYAICQNINWRELRYCLLPPARGACLAVLSRCASLMVLAGLG